MRIPRSLAWLILVLAFLTAGILRQFHDRTPAAPAVSPAVGSLLFAAIFFLLLVSAREWRRGAVAGRGVRLGSLTPILLMLLIEKWISLTVYPWLHDSIAPAAVPEALQDAQYRALAGVGLIAVCVLVARFSAPTRHKTWRRARPARWPAAAAGTFAAVAGTYLLLGGTGWLLGGGLVLRTRLAGETLPWVLGGQAVLAFAEEVYYRGLILSELERLAPRLGARRAEARRWLALSGSALLFSIEHLNIDAPWDAALREMVFALSLGLLLGILVMVSSNLHFAGGIHAWINWLLLGAAPYFADADGAAALPPGTYIGVTLVLSFVLAFVVQRYRGRPVPRTSIRA